ncbi:MAG: hypothetical protein A2Z35_00775 [Actinobacteria bacterium RBG_19FT_COMBO_36_27]|nr:MAG: hypothetical protein A2Z35_00775 [Actinobacteria bacterium RBG_19FT_COMBO_36_27]OGD37946.1 MAG: hypothetical protein A2V94_00650 [Candidatus Atribacteria bacterium RBG_16_35_8]
MIAGKNADLIFVEVKTRTGLEYGDPLEAVNKSKIKRIRKIASFYILQNKLLSSNPNFSVISVTLNINLIKEVFKKNNTLSEIITSDFLKINKDIKIEHIINAF